jgi:predicted Fe-Mo cluster-binding NifX family protein
MKIALPTANRQIDDHFGHCAYYTVYTVNDNKEITAMDVVQSPGGCGCKSNIVHTLADMGVKVMLAGNMGDGALNVLASRGIEVIRGVPVTLRVLQRATLREPLKIQAKGATLTITGMSARTDVCSN